MIAMLLASVFTAIQPPAQPAAPASSPSPSAEAPAKALIPFPHPLITEVLYAVPSRDAGDANGDGKRDVNGDEFIELVNPHDKPIQLGGYILSDRELGEGEKKTTSLRFTFPVLELKPGEVVVVFNGHNQNWTGPVGDAAKAPERGNDRFHSARVFTMGITSEKMGLANNGDCVQLTAPDGKVIHCIHWGEAKPSKTALKNEEAPLVNAQSIQRLNAMGAMLEHPESGGHPFSPGQWPMPTETTAPANNPEAKPAEAAPTPGDKKPEVKNPK